MTSSELGENYNKILYWKLLKATVALLIIVFLAFFQHSLNVMDKPNEICNNDQILYSILFEDIHEYLKTNKNVSDFMLAVNSLWFDII